MEAFRKVAPLHTVQPPYNFFERRIEKDVLPYARRNHLTVLAYGALCRGLLTGKITAATCAIPIPSSGRCAWASISRR